MGNVYDIHLSEKDGTETVKFSGQLIINHIEKIYAELNEKLKFDCPLVVVIDNPENIDITFIQLVISLRKLWSECNLAFSIKAEVKSEHMQLIEKAGLQTQIK